MSHIGSVRIRLLILLETNMNKKLATLLFAIGLGLAGNSALAFGPLDPPSCAQQCFTLFKACKAAGVPEGECQMDFSACRDRCGI